ncbi:kinase-like protein [Aspergillus sclerotioniger CBS 115572]|uniref:non-specific serine/threonine protein kinase n=1 Tax=Aspergillus sclerotioniger CBS 115572 TaxID=1450535 RepID=A0A317X7R3_9EURO|nr:kinase-like protein [Aspergillus sclerotioniger CBS 115572]PWY94241.1 kinase-like protein [Aspergillus sclerotioniger CBS 115572]
MNNHSSPYRHTDLLYTQESFARYQPGGYHPVSLGDTFKDGRYEVHHKLGWGGYSTVWLVRDLERQDQWASLKIMAADRSVESCELNNLRRLEKHSQGSLSSKYIVQFLDTSFHQGPNGPEERLGTETILRISKQLLEGIAFIHDAGMGHGDISGANIAFSGSRLSKASKEEIFEVLGTPEIDRLSRTDGQPLEKGVPRHLVKVANWMEWIDEDDEDIRILDLGEKPIKLAQPGPLRVPETIFTECFDYKVDLWRAGCMLYMFIFKTYPFHYWGKMSACSAQMIGFIEKLPIEWQPVWQHMRSDSKFAMQVDETCNASKLDEIFYTNVSDPALAPLLPVIKGLLRFMPSDRMEASKALDLLQSMTSGGT